MVTMFENLEGCPDAKLKGCMCGVCTLVAVLECMLKKLGTGPAASALRRMRTYSSMQSK